MFTSQTVENMRYDRLKPACVTFIMAEPSGDEKKYDKRRLTVYDETTGQKYFDILDSYLVFVPNVIKNNKNTDDDLYIFSYFLAIGNQGQADDFERDHGAKPLGMELIRLYANAVANKTRLLDLTQYNYYFTEKEYERVKLEDEEKHAREIARIEKWAKEQLEAKEQLLEAAERTKEQLLKAAVKFINSGMDINVVSANLNIPVSDIESYISGGKKDKTKFAEQ